jgi:broad specificity phosphatase PhoE
MSAVHLIRHAHTQPNADVPSPEWGLTAEGREAARVLALRDEWLDLTLVASSPEPKARATAEPIAVAAALDLRIERDLREAGRPWVDGDYGAVAGRYLAGEEILGWEPADEVRERMQRAVRVLAVEAGGPLAVVSHGLALSVLLGLSPAEWEALPFGEVVAVLDGSS